MIDPTLSILCNYPLFPQIDLCHRTNIYLKFTPFLLPIFNQRYIEYASDYEILLSKDTRNQIYDIMSHKGWTEDDDIDINMILKSWDDVSEELFMLLLDGLSRFSTTAQSTTISNITL